MRNIILVDDDSDDREIFAEAVSNIDSGVQIHMKKDGEELMAHLLRKSSVPDLIFLDLNMPRKNGKECLAEINSDEDLRKIPVIIFSTSLNPFDVEETYNMGACHFLRKPNSFAELKDALAQIFQPDDKPAESKSRENFVISTRLIPQSK